MNSVYHEFLFLFLLFTFHLAATDQISSRSISVSRTSSTITITMSSNEKLDKTQKSNDEKSDEKSDSISTDDEENQENGNEEIIESNDQISVNQKIKEELNQKSIETPKANQISSKIEEIQDSNNEAEKSNDDVKSNENINGVNSEFNTVQIAEISKDNETLNENDITKNPFEILDESNNGIKKSEEKTIEHGEVIDKISENQEIRVDSKKDLKKSEEKSTDEKSVETDNNIEKQEIEYGSKEELKKFEEKIHDKSDDKKIVQELSAKNIETRKISNVSKSMDESDEKSDDKVHEVSVLSSETETEQLLIIAMVNRFAQMRERIFAPNSDMVELQSLAPVHAILQAINEVAVDKFLIQRKRGQFECRQDLHELLHETDLVKNVFTNILLQNTAPDGQDKFTMAKLLIDDGVGSLQLLFSFATRIAATVGNINVTEHVSQNNIAEVAGNNNVEETAGKETSGIRFQFQCDNNNVAETSSTNIPEINSTNTAQYLSAFLTTYKCIKQVADKEEKIYDYRIVLKWVGNEENGEKTMLLQFGWKPGTDAERQIARANFAFLQLLSQRRLTPIEVVDVAHKMDNSVGMAGAMAGRDSSATEVFSAVTQHFSTTVSANSGEPATQSWTRSDMLCNIATFGRNLLARIMDDEHFSTYFDQIGTDPKIGGRAKIGINSEILFLKKSLTDYASKYCSAVQEYIRRQTVFEYNECFLHYEIAIPIDWNPWREMIRTVDGVRSKLISDGVFKNSFNHNAKESAELEKVLQKLEQNSGILAQKISAWKNEVKLAEKAGADVLEELERIRAKFEEKTAEFDREEMVKMMKKK